MFVLEATPNHMQLKHMCPIEISNQIKRFYLKLVGSFFLSRAKFSMSLTFYVHNFVRVEWIISSGWGREVVLGGNPEGECIVPKVVPREHVHQTWQFFMLPSAFEALMYDGMVVSSYTCIFWFFFHPIMVGESLFEGIGQANMRTFPSQDLQREALYNINDG